MSWYGVFEPLAVPLPKPDPGKTRRFLLWCQMLEHLSGYTFWYDKAFHEPTSTLTLWQSNIAMEHPLLCWMTAGRKEHRPFHHDTSTWYIHKQGFSLYCACTCLCSFNKFQTWQCCNDFSATPEGNPCHHPERISIDLEHGDLITMEVWRVKGDLSGGALFFFARRFLRLKKP